MPCLPEPRAFEVPPPGAGKAAFAFHKDRDRELFFIMPRNHLARPPAGFNPRVMLVGLSPAGNQIQGFLDKYRATGNYDEAARWASFRDMEEDIAAMFVGLGIDKHLGIVMRGLKTFAGHPDILTNSLVKCASLTLAGSSDDFDPQQYASNVRCIKSRFFAEATHPQFTKLSHIFIFGERARVALQQITMSDRKSVWTALEGHGKNIFTLPHPSGQNGEYVRLAKLPADHFPAEEEYADRKWREYSTKPPRKGRKKQSEGEYKNKRRRYWREIASLRARFST
jgi:hypothetical protein